MLKSGADSWWNCGGRGPRAAHQEPLTLSSGQMSDSSTHQRTSTTQDRGSSVRSTGRHAEMPELHSIQQEVAKIVGKLNLRRPLGLRQREALKRGRCGDGCPGTSSQKVSTYSDRGSWPTSSSQGSTRRQGLSTAPARTGLSALGVALSSRCGSICGPPSWVDDAIAQTLPPVTTALPTVPRKWSVPEPRKPSSAVST
jgi:hypothetical protein